ncbi:MAG: hypothetical protein LBM08_03980 [Dysgonamonadaceae bacterium]|jgi:hypothetical protein|nr:hypothetical protein [Dysgonamonadaceae bacterium]
MKNKNVIKRALLVQKILKEHYEPGRQDRCKLWVWRNVINKIYPISEATFFRYLKVLEDAGQEPAGRQSDLFDDINEDKDSFS